MADYGDAMMRNPNAAVQARTKAQNRANVMQLKLIGQSHPTGLTANLLKLFEPRPPLEYKPPPEKRKCLPYAGVAQFVKNFAEPGDPEYAPPVQKGETPAARRARIHQIRLEEGAKKAAEELEKYDPNSDPNISGDPYKTLFVARLNYESTESRIRREFEAYGPIKRVRLVMDKESNKPRGYAFIEYLHTRDMKAAYKQADGKKIDNRRVLVDVERGRTVPNWRPRRLGGGLGTTRISNVDASLKPLGSAQPGVVSRSEEPRSEREREKSDERGGDRDREREKSREVSHDRPREREHRDDKHHRDRERNKGRSREHDHSRNSERERDHDRDRARDRDHGRERAREHDKERKHDRHRDRDKKRERDYEAADDRERGRSHDREHEYEYEQDRRDSKHDRSKRQRKYEIDEGEDAREWAGHAEAEVEPDGHYNYYVSQGRGAYDKREDHGGYGSYREPDHDNDPYGRPEDGYMYEPDATEQRDHDYRRSERPRSRDYGY